MRNSHRLQVRLTSEQAGSLRSLAAARGLGLSATVRELIAHAAASPSSPEELPALAGLVSVEQVLLMLRDFMPEGSLRAAQAREQALLAAEWRLAELRESGVGGPR